LRLEKTEPIDDQLSGFAYWFLADVRTDGVNEDAANIAVSHTERQDPETIRFAPAEELHLQGTDRLMLGEGPRFAAVLGRNAKNHQDRPFAVDFLQLKICTVASNVVLVPLIKENSLFSKTLSHSGRDRLNKIALLASEGERDKELLWNLRGWHRFHRPPRLPPDDLSSVHELIFIGQIGILNAILSPRQRKPLPACRAKNSDNRNVRFHANFLSSLDPSMP